MAKKEKKESKAAGGNAGLKGALIGLGVVDAFCMVLLVLSLVVSPAGGSEVQAETLGEFETSGDNYAQNYYEETYAAAAAVNYTSPTAPSTTAAPAVTMPADPNNLYVGFLFPNSNTVLLTDTDIATHANSQELCQRAINEIYARRGYQFTKQANLDFFNQYPWYVAMAKSSDMNAVSQSMNDIEKANVKKLQDYEKAHNWN